MRNLAGSPLQIIIQFIGDAASYKGAVKEIVAGQKQIAAEAKKTGAAMAANLNTQAIAANKTAGAMKGLGNSQGYLNQQKLATETVFLANAFDKTSGVINKKYLSSIKGLREGLHRFREESKDTIVVTKNLGGVMATTLNDPSMAKWSSYLQKNLVTRTIDNMGKSLVSMGKNAQWTGRQLMVGLTAPLAGIAALSIKSALSIEQAELAIRKLIHNGVSGVGQLEAAMGKLDKQSTDLSTTLGVTRIEVKTMQQEFASVGFDPKTISDLTELTTKFQQLTRLDASQAVEFVRVLKQQKSAFSDQPASIKEVEDTLQRLNIIENTTALNMQDVVGSFADLYPLMRQLNTTAPETIAFLAAFKQGGIDVSQGVTTLKQVLSKLTAALSLRDLGGKSGAARLKFLQDQLVQINQEFGVQIQFIDESTGKIRTGVDLMLQLGNAWKLIQDAGTGRAQEFGFALSRAIGVGEHSADFMQLMDAISKSLDKSTVAGQDFAKAMDEAHDATGRASTAWAEQLAMFMGSDNIKFQNSLNHIINVAQDLGRKLIPVATKIFDIIGGIVDKFDHLSDGTKNIVLGLAGIAALLGPVIYAAGQFMIASGVVVRGLIAPFKQMYNAGVRTRDMFKGTRDEAAKLGSIMEILHETGDQQKAIADFKNLTSGIKGSNTAVEASTVAQEELGAATEKTARELYNETIKAKAFGAAMQEALRPSQPGIRNVLGTPNVTNLAKMTLDEKLQAPLGGHGLNLGVSQGLESSEVQAIRKAGREKQLKALVAGHMLMKDKVTSQRVIVDPSVAKRAEELQVLITNSDKTLAKFLQDMLTNQALTDTQMAQMPQSAMRKEAEYLGGLKKRINGFQKAFGMNVPIAPNIDIEDDMIRLRDFGGRFDEFEKSIHDQVRTMATNSDTQGRGALGKNLVGFLSRGFGGGTDTSHMTTTTGLAQLQSIIASKKSGSPEAMISLLTTAIKEGDARHNLNNMQNSSALMKAFGLNTATIDKAADTIITEAQINNPGTQSFANYFKEMAAMGRSGNMPVRGGVGKGDDNAIRLALRDVVQVREAGGAPRAFTGHALEQIRAAILQGADGQKYNEVEANIVSTLEQGLKELNKRINDPSTKPGTDVYKGLQDKVQQLAIDSRKGMGDRTTKKQQPLLEKLKDTLTTIYQKQAKQTEVLLAGLNDQFTTTAEGSSERASIGGTRNQLQTKITKIHNALKRMNEAVTNRNFIRSEDLNEFKTLFIDIEAIKNSIKQSGIKGSSVTPLSIPDLGKKVNELTRGVLTKINENQYTQVGKRKFDEVFHTNYESLLSTKIDKVMAAEFSEDEVSAIESQVKKLEKARQKIVERELKPNEKAAIQRTAEAVVKAKRLESVLLTDNELKKVTAKATAAARKTLQDLYQAGSLGLGQGEQRMARRLLGGGKMLGDMDPGKGIGAKLPTEDTYVASSRSTQFNKSIKEILGLNPTQLMSEGDKIVSSIIGEFQMAEEKAIAEIPVNKLGLETGRSQAIKARNIEIAARNVKAKSVAIAQYVKDAFASTNTSQFLRTRGMPPEIKQAVVGAIFGMMQQEDQSKPGMQNFVEGYGGQLKRALGESYSEEALALVNQLAADLGPILEGVGVEGVTSADVKIFQDRAKQAMARAHPMGMTTDVGIRASNVGSSEYNIALTLKRQQVITQAKEFIANNSTQLKGLKSELESLVSQKAATDEFYGKQLVTLKAELLDSDRLINALSAQAGFSGKEGRSKVATLQAAIAKKASDMGGPIKDMKELQSLRAVMAKRKAGGSDEEFHTMARSALGYASGEGEDLQLTTIERLAEERQVALEKRLMQISDKISGGKKGRIASLSKIIKQLTAQMDSEIEQLSGIPTQMQGRRTKYIDELSKVNKEINKINTELFQRGENDKFVIPAGQQVYNTLFGEGGLQELEVAANSKEEEIKRLDQHIDKVIQKLPKERQALARLTMAVNEEASTKSSVGSVTSFAAEAEKVNVNKQAEIKTGITALTADGEKVHATMVQMEELVQKNSVVTETDMAALDAAMEGMLKRTVIQGEKGGPRRFAAGVKLNDFNVGPLVGGLSPEMASILHEMVVKQVEGTIVEVNGAVHHGIEDATAIVKKWMPDIPEDMVNAYAEKAIVIARAMRADIDKAELVFGKTLRAQMVEATKRSSMSGGLGGEKGSGLSIADRLTTMGNELVTGKQNDIQVDYTSAAEQVKYEKDFHKTLPKNYVAPEAVLNIVEMGQKEITGRENALIKSNRALKDIEDRIKSCYLKEGEALASHNKKIRQEALHNQAVMEKELKEAQLIQSAAQAQMDRLARTTQLTVIGETGQTQIFNSYAEYKQNRTRQILALVNTADAEGNFPFAAELDAAGEAELTKVLEALQREAERQQKIDQAINNQIRDKAAKRTQINFEAQSGPGRRLVTVLTKHKFAMGPAEAVILAEMHANDVSAGIAMKEYKAHEIKSFMTFQAQTEEMAKMFAGMSSAASGMPVAVPSIPLAAAGSGSWQKLQGSIKGIQGVEAASGKLKRTLGGRLGSGMWINQILDAAMWQGMSAGATEGAAAVGGLSGAMASFGQMFNKYPMMISFFPMMQQGVGQLITKTGPWGIALLAVAGAVLLIWKNWDAVSQGMGHALQSLIDAGKHLGDVLLIPFKGLIDGGKKAGGVSETWKAVGQTLGAIASTMALAINILAAVLTPVMILLKTVIHIVVSLITAFSSIPASIQQIIIVLGLLAAAWKVGLIDLFISRLQMLGPAAERTGAKMKAFATVTNLALGGIAIGIAAIAMNLQHMRDMVDAGKSDVGKGVEELIAKTSHAPGGATPEDLSARYDRLAQTYNELITAYDTLNGKTHIWDKADHEKSQAMSGQLTALKENLDHTTQQYNNQKTSLEKLRSEYNITTAAILEFAAANGLADLTGDPTDMIKRFEDAWNKAQTAVAENPIVAEVDTTAVDDATNKVKSFISAWQSEMQKIMEGWKEAALAAFDDWVKIQLDAFDKTIIGLEAVAKAQTDALDAQLKVIDDQVKAEQQHQQDLDFLQRKEELRNKRRTENIKFSADRDLAIYEGRYDDAAQLTQQHEVTLSDMLREEQTLDKERQQTLTDRARTAEQERLNNLKAGLQDELTAKKDAAQKEKEALQTQLDVKKTFLQQELDAMTEFLPRNVQAAADMHNAILAKMGEYTGGYQAIGTTHMQAWNQGWDEAIKGAQAHINEEMWLAGQEAMNMFAQAAGVDPKSLTQAPAPPASTVNTNVGVPGGTSRDVGTGTNATGKWQTPRTNNPSWNWNHQGGFIGSENSSPADVPATLQTGEYVVRRAAVAKLGSQFMDSVNRGDPKYHEGGLIGQVANMATSNSVAHMRDQFFNAGGRIAGWSWEELKAEYASRLQAISGIAGGSELAQTIINAALSWLGVPYLWGGTDPSVGLDCSGLVLKAYQAAGISLPRVSQDQAQSGREVSDGGALADLVYFGNPASHIGLNLGGGQMIHAPHTGDVVRISGIGAASGMRRILQDQSFGALGSIGTSFGAGSAQDKARQALADWGWEPNQWDALNALVSHESGWRTDAKNPNSEAAGLFQFLKSTWDGYISNRGGPAYWANDVDWQIRGGLDYIKSRYGSPQAAWDFWQSRAPINGRDVGNWYHQGGMTFPVPHMMDGGSIAKSGLAQVHAGETVVTEKLSRAVEESGLGDNISFPLHFEGGYFGTDRELEKLVDTIETRILPKIRKIRGQQNRTFSKVIK